MAPHYKQSRVGACLPACARMVLAALEDERTESQLAKIMDTLKIGTPASRITRLEKWGYRVQYGPSSLDALQSRLEQGLFPIVFVYAEFLPWSDFEGPHAVVLTEITPTDVALLDPALDDGPTQLSIESFLLAWEEFDSRAAVISLA